MFFKVFAKSLSNLAHDSWEDCFPKPKLLLAADNRPIYLNMPPAKPKIHSSRSPRAPSFLHRMTTSGAQIRPVLKKSHLFHEVKKPANLYYKNNYNSWK